MTVEGLKPGTTYVFRVRARTDGGYGNYGGEIELETSHEGNDSMLLSTVSYFFYFLLYICPCFVPLSIVEQMLGVSGHCF